MGFKIQSKTEREQEEANRLQKIDTEIEERVDERNEKLRQLIQINKRNKLIFLIALFSIVLLSLFFGIYNTFIRKEITTDDALERVVQYQNFNFFPTEGVQGYLREFIKPILESSISVDSQVFERITPLPNTIGIEDITTFNSNFALATISCDVQTKEKDTKVDNEVIKGKTATYNYRFLIPLFYNQDTKGFSLSGNVTLLLMFKYNSNTKSVENPRYSFDEKIIGKTILPLDAEKSNSAKTFMTNFLTMVYNVKDADVSSMLSVPEELDELNRTNLTYNQINNFAIYSEDNAAGFNAYISYSVTDTVSNITFNTYHNLKLVESGNSWILERITR